MFCTLEYTIMMGKLLISLFLVQVYLSGISNSQHEASLSEYENYFSLITDPENQENRIVGGQATSRGKCPWQALIFLNEGKSLCGGTIISKEWILTAGHCAHNVSSILVVLGVFNMSYVEPGIKVYKIQNAYVHPSYSSQSPSTNGTVNDIALLKLEPAIPSYTSFISPVRLPRYSDIKKTFTGTQVAVVGWGLTKDGGEVSKTLNFMIAPVISNEECKKSGWKELILDSMMCLSAKGIVDSCQGDSGGPALYAEDDGELTQIGVVSFGYVSCMDEFPGVYTRITHFLRWISTVTQLKFRP